MSKFVLRKSLKCLRIATSFRINKPFCIGTFIFTILFLTGCGSSSASQTQQATVTGQQAISTSMPTSIPTSLPTTSLPPTAIPPTLTPTSTQVVGLRGPTNFVLSIPFSFTNTSGTGTVNGATFQLSAETIQKGVTANLQHTLFTIDSNNDVKVYTNTSTSPIVAQTSQNADGSTNIQYEHSSTAGTTMFNGTLAGSQMKATYSGDFLSGTTVDGQTFSGGNNSSATFTTQVNWVSSDQIPASPTQGSHQITTDGGVTISWMPGTSGATAKQYDIYRFVLTSNQGFQFLTTTSDTSYTDESSVARSNAQTITGMAYAIYAVGPTGVENPEDIVISVSSLG